MTAGRLKTKTSLKFGETETTKTPRLQVCKVLRSSSCSRTELLKPYACLMISGRTLPPPPVRPPSTSTLVFMNTLDQMLTPEVSPQIHDLPGSQTNEHSHGYESKPFYPLVRALIGIPKLLFATP